MFTTVKEKIMKTKLIKIAATALLIASTSAQATLESRLGGLAVYDTETNLTWTADANPNGYKNWTEQINFVENLVIDGIDAWQMPTTPEIRGVLSNISTCMDTTSYFYCIFSEEKIHNVGIYFLKDSFGIFDDPTSSIDREIGALYIPEIQDWVFIEDNANTITAGVWPVYHGDVAAAAIPEPQTYATLLAGLGLMGFMRGKVL